MKINFKKIVTLVANLLLVVDIISLFALGYVYRSQIKFQIQSVLAKNHLLPEPENLTELYFEYHNILPKTIVRRQIYNFTFTVHNLENKDMDYPYLVYLETTDKKIVLDQGVVSLKDGAYKSVTEDFGPLKPIRMKITVELVGRNQPIAFWMEGETPQ